MQARWSRAVLLGLAIVAVGVVAFVASSKALLGWSGTAGWTVEPSRPYAVRVADVGARSAAERAGVLTGDEIDLRRLSFADRTMLLLGPVAVRALHVSADRGGARRELVVEPRRTWLRWDQWVGYAVIGWMAVCAGIIAWRRAELADARLLSLMLSAYAAGQALQFLHTPSAAVDVAVSTLTTSGLLGTISVVSLIAFTALFARPLSRTRRVVNAIAYAGAGLMALESIVAAIGIVTLRLDPVPHILGIAGGIVNSGSYLLALAAGALAIAASRGFERQRVTWAVLSIGLLLGIFVLQDAFLFLSAGVDVRASMQAVGNIAAIVAPLGLTYSVLSRRLLDIGFVLNRAAVFSGVSLIVVGLFMIVETVIGGWLVTVKHATTPMTGIVIALCLGFSVRFIHKRVDAVVDRLFFHRRHEHERALLDFAHEAAFVTDAAELLARTVAEVVRHSEAAEAAILVRDAAVYRCARDYAMPLPDVPENDPAILALRASSKQLDLHTRTGALHGEYAFPMLARGTLGAVLVCGRKRSGDAYAPDELAALTELARCVGMALDALERDQPQRGAKPAVALEAAILALHAEFTAVRAEIRELRDALLPRTKN